MGRKVKPEQEEPVEEREPRAPSVKDLPAALARQLEAVDPAVFEGVEIEDSFTETEEEARERRARQGMLKRARWEERLPMAYANASLADYPEDVAAKFERVLNDPRVLVVVFAGPVGTGKTHAGYALGRLAVAAGRWVEAWSVHDLMTEMMPSAPDPALMESRAKGCGVLLLDDLGAGRVSDFTVDTITSILDARVAHHRKTIITTNAAEQALREVWGDRLMDRIRQGLVAHTFTGPSRRQPAW